MKKLIVLCAGLTACVLAGCAARAPELLYADGSVRVPVNAHHDKPVTKQDGHAVE